MISRPAFRGFVGFCLLLTSTTFLTGCLGKLRPDTASPSHVGKYAVGVTTLHVEDASRDRELDVEVWYPADPAVARGKAAVYNVRAAGMTVARLRSAVGAQRNVAAWRGEGRRPVVLLSHGAGSSRFANESLSEILASHGYVVAAPDHAGHTVADKVFGISDDDRAQSAFDRPLDLSRVLDTLDSPDSGPLLKGLIDINRVAVAGHSFGGRTALGMVGARFDAVRQQQECLQDEDDRRCRALPVFGDTPYRYRDERIKAALLIAPAGYKFYRGDGVAQVNAPVLVVGADRDETTPFNVHHRPIFESLTSEHYLLELHDAGHLTATDVCEVVSSVGFVASAFGGPQASDGCGETFLSTRTALERVAEASLPFFDLYLNDDATAEERLLNALGPSARPRPAERLVKAQPRTVKAQPRTAKDYGPPGQS